MSRTTRLILSAIVAGIFLIFSYWITNLNFPISGEKTILCYMGKIQELFWPEEEPDNDIICVDVTYDKVACVAFDEENMPLGTTAIVDRHKLLQLLQFLKEHDDYRYILLDVFFAKGITTEWDEELFETILSMPRIVIPYHEDEQMADERLLAKSGLADYKKTLLESDFVKYPYIIDSMPSIPTRMYEDITGREIRKHGFIYSDGWWLARKSIVLTFDTRMKHNSEDFNDFEMEGYDLSIYKLGVGLLGCEIPGVKNGNSASMLSIFPDLLSDKYVIIGSFFGDEDMHTTYLGDMPGVLIIYNAFKSLMNGRHIVSAAGAIIMFAVYFIFCNLILSRRLLRRMFLRWAVWFRSKSSGSKDATCGCNGVLSKASRALCVLCCGMMKLLSRIFSYSWINYSLLLSIMCIWSYLELNEVYDIFFTSTVFWAFDALVRSYGKIVRCWTGW